MSEKLGEQIERVQEHAQTGRLRRWTNALPQFALGVAAGLTAIGIAGFFRWLREPIVGPQRSR